MPRAKLFLLLSGFIVLTASTSLAQFPVINADELRSWMQGKRKVMLVDVRPAEEYRAGHIPGAVNIPADQVRWDAGRLPKDKAVPIIFYCRGME